MPELSVAKLVVRGERFSTGVGQQIPPRKKPALRNRGLQLLHRAPDLA